MPDSPEFIDAEQEFKNEASTYEQIVLKQLQKCVDVLSKEVIGGGMRQRQSKTGANEVYIEDVRAVIINTVSTFKILLSPFIKDPYIDKLKKIDGNIKEYVDKVGERKVKVAGKGTYRIKDLGVVPADSSAYRELIEFKSESYREMFAILILAYNKYKGMIEQFSSE